MHRFFWVFKIQCSFNNAAKTKKKKKSNQLSVLLETAVKAASLCSLRHLPLLTNEVVTAGSCLILAAMPQIN